MVGKAARGGALVEKNNIESTDNLEQQKGECKRSPNARSEHVATLVGFEIVLSWARIS